MSECVCDCWRGACRELLIRRQERWRSDGPADGREVGVTARKRGLNRLSDVAAPFGVSDRNAFTGNRSSVTMGGGGRLLLIAGVSEPARRCVCVCVRNVLLPRSSVLPVHGRRRGAARAFSFVTWHPRTGISVRSVSCYLYLFSCPRIHKRKKI